MACSKPDQAPGAATRGPHAAARARIRRAGIVPAGRGASCKRCTGDAEGMPSRVPCVPHASAARPQAHWEGRALHGRQPQGARRGRLGPCAGEGRSPSLSSTLLLPEGVVPWEWTAALERLRKVVSQAQCGCSAALCLLGCPQEPAKQAERMRCVASGPEALKLLVLWLVGCRSRRATRASWWR